MAKRPPCGVGRPGGVSLWALRVLTVGACVAERIGGAQSAHAIF